MPLTSEQTALKDETHRLAETVLAPRAQEIDRSRRFPAENLAAIA